ERVARRNLYVGNDVGSAAHSPHSDRACMEFSVYELNGRITAFGGRRLTHLRERLSQHGHFVFVEQSRPEGVQRISRASRHRENNTHCHVLPARLAQRVAANQLKAHFAGARVRGGVCWSETREGGRLDRGKRHCSDGIELAYAW